jgi:hypothetical protein
MKLRRAQIQFDEKTYQAIRRRAYDNGCSLSAVVRDLVERGLSPEKPKKRLSLKDLPFVGCARSKQGELAPVSERHDEALTEAISEEHRP